MVFENSFFSWAGQKERLSNVANVLKIAVNPFSKDKIVATTPSKTANAALEAVANNPYTTAGIVTLGTTGLLSKGVSSAISSAKTSTKIVAGISSIAAAGAVAGNPSLVAPILKGASSITPESISKYSFKAGQISKTSDKPIETATEIKNLLKSNPVLSGAIIGGAAIVGGKALQGAATTYYNSRTLNEMKEQTKTFKKGVESASGIKPNNLESMPTIKDDSYKIAELQAKQQEKLAKLELKAQKQAQKAQLEAMKIQAAQAVAVTSPISTATEAPLTKTPAKKKKKKAGGAKKKKKKAKTKKKAAPKRKRRTTKKKKTKTIKRKTSKRKK